MVEISSSRDGLVRWPVFDLKQDLEVSIKELETRLAQAREFQRRFNAGVLMPGDTYLSFGVVTIPGHGYDRTGPDLISIPTED